MNRLLAILCFSFLMGCSVFNERPNIVIIVCSDLGHWVNYTHRNPIIKTPNLNHLTNRGISFNNFYAVAPETNASRAGIFSGLYPNESGIYDEFTRWSNHITPKQTINSYLKRHGYYTLATGDIHPFITDSVEGVHLYQKSKSHLIADTLKKGNAAGFKWAILEGNDSVMQDEGAIQFVKEHLHKPLPKPFLMMVGLSKPAAPFYIPKKYYDIYPKDSVYLPKIQDWDLHDINLKSVYKLGDDLNYTQNDSLDSLFAVSRAYMASISYVDAQIGRILRSMETSRNMRKTIVILTSDKGLLMGEKHHMGSRSLWEESVRIPLYISVPQQKNSRQICFNTIDATQLFPTICDLIDIKTPGYIKSKSFKKMLRNPYGVKNTIAISQLPNKNVTTRTRAFRYIQYEDGNIELYDERNDNHEWYNLGYNSKYRSILQEMQTLVPEQFKAYRPDSTINAVPNRH